jgi:chromosome partitioning protein
MTETAMAIYAIWNNKGGVGKSYLTFQVAAEYARVNPKKKVLVIDMCPQANASSMLLGGIVDGEKRLNEIHLTTPRSTISGYIADRIFQPYANPKTGARYATQVSKFNKQVPDNVFLVVGDEQLEIQSSRITAASLAGPDDGWRIVHTWISDLIADVMNSWNKSQVTVFIDCNPSFSICTELALSASDRLIVPFSVDGSSKRAVRAVFSLVFGISRQDVTTQLSEFHLNSMKFRMATPKLYMYVGNRLTQGNQTSAEAFKAVVNEIGEEIHAVWKRNSNMFCVHPNGAPVPSNKNSFKAMFQYEVNDANSASVVSGACGIPIYCLTSGIKNILGRKVVVNQTQLDKQVPNITKLVAAIE